MSKKTQEQILLIPGGDGWNLWLSSPSGVTLLRATTESYALDIEKFPMNKPLLMAFPVKELTALELWLPAQEKESVGDLISFQVENVGLGQGEEHGTLTQHTYVSHNSETGQDLYSIDVLRAPAEGTLPAKSPNRFSVSPRCFKFQEEAVTLWKEFGAWVACITDGNGKVLHYQGFNNERVGREMLQDLQFVIGHLLMQGILATPPKDYIFWTDEEGVVPEGVSELDESVERSIQVRTKPLPVVPEAGVLLPADTRAERLAAKARMQKSILTGCALFLLLGTICYAGYKLWKLEGDAAVAQVQSDTLTAENQVILDHYKRWEELEPLVDSQNSPLKLLLKTTQELPSAGIRLKRAEFTHQISTQGAGTILTLSLQGEANEFELATSFDANLKKSKRLEGLEWTNQNPTQTKTGWGFLYSADRN